MRVDKWVFLFFVVLMGLLVLGTYTHEINVGLYTIHTSIQKVIDDTFITPDYETWNTTTVDNNAYSSVNNIAFLLPLAIVGAGAMLIAMGAFAFR